MPDKYEFNNKLGEIELGLFLTNNLWLLESLKNKRVRFNPRPFKKPTRTSIKKVGEEKDNLVDFHLEIVKKIDEIIEKNQRETVDIDNVVSSEKKPDSLLKSIVEIREPWVRKTEISQFTPELRFKGDTNRLEGFEDELFEVENPMVLGCFENVETPLVKKENKTHNIFEEKDENLQHKTIMSLGRIKIRRNNVKKTGKNRGTSVKKDKKHVTGDNGNGLSTVKKELEKTKMELEKKKKELEEMKRKARLKEEELKKKKEERKKREKLRKLELKKLAREEKIKNREAKKKAREKEKMRRKLEREKKLEAKKRELEEMKRKARLKEEELKKKKEEQRKKGKLRKLELKKLGMGEKIRKKMEKGKVEKETFEKKEKLVGLFNKKRKDKTVETASTVKDKSGESKKVEDFNWDEEVREALVIIDRLLEKLPDNAIDEFVQSKDFEVYERVVSKYKNLGK
ncbi:MAG: hypothetical protein ACTSXD_12365 [Candidatus Heimdallarchaeaceae archaeon]